MCLESWYDRLGCCQFVMIGPRNHSEGDYAWRWNQSISTTSTSSLVSLNPSRRNLWVLQIPERSDREGGKVEGKWIGMHLRTAVFWKCSSRVMLITGWFAELMRRGPDFCEKRSCAPSCYVRSLTLSSFLLRKSYWEVPLWKKLCPKHDVRIRKRCSFANNN